MAFIVIQVYIYINTFIYYIYIARRAARSPRVGTRACGVVGGHRRRHRDAAQGGGPGLGPVPCFVETSLQSEKEAGTLSGSLVEFLKGSFGIFWERSHLAVFRRGLHFDW